LTNAIDEHDDRESRFDQPPPRQPLPSEHAEARPMREQQDREGEQDVDQARR
jgi:hypothetical protein